MPIRILIRTTVLPIRGVIGTTVVRNCHADKNPYRHDRRADSLSLNLLECRESAKKPPEIFVIEGHYGVLTATKALLWSSLGVLLRLYGVLVIVESVITTELISQVIGFFSGIYVSLVLSQVLIFFFVIFTRYFSRLEVHI